MLRRLLPLLILGPLGCSLNPKGELPSVGESADAPAQASSDPQPASPVVPPPVGSGPGAIPEDSLVDEEDPVDSPCPPPIAVERDGGSDGDAAAADLVIGDAGGDPAWSGDAGAPTEVTQDAPCGAR